MALVPRWHVGMIVRRWCWWALAAASVLAVWLGAHLAADGPDEKDAYLRRIQVIRVDIRNRQIIGIIRSYVRKHVGNIHGRSKASVNAVQRGKDSGRACTVRRPARPSPRGVLSWGPCPFPCGLGRLRLCLCPWPSVVSQADCRACEYLLYGARRG